ncbi:unnamed protein product [Staurois parvus]|uniref:Uncharacterized protein n=1 Tax=Staurois parvus TaxID=386267 RepID=A0ABN9G920_9NEOB|nr:unnamed protein product [Staurois parvus]
MIGCSAKMMPNALKWQPKPERRGRKRKTTIGMDRRIAKMGADSANNQLQEDERSVTFPVRTQPTISSRKMKEGVRFPPKSHCWEKDVC